jgi:hypothetical protein
MAVFLVVIACLGAAARAQDASGRGSSGPAASGLGATEPPVLQIESPSELASVAERVRRFDTAQLGFAMRLTGLMKAGPPIRVALAQEGSGPARSAPDWASGYAYGASGTVVLIPARANSYPYGSLESLLQHEVTHVLVARAAGGRSVPRWFNEGLAMVAAREWTMGDRSRLFLELLPGNQVPATRLDELFDRSSRAGADRAYALSAAYVRDLVDRYGVDFPGAVLAGLARGETFEEAFRRSTGVTLDDATQAFYSRTNFWNLWLPALTSGVTLWTAVTLLALWAAKKRREKSNRIRRAWEDEEPASAGAAPGFGSPPPFQVPPTNGAPHSGPPPGEN